MHPADTVNERNRLPFVVRATRLAEIGKQTDHLRFLTQVNVDKGPDFIPIGQPVNQVFRQGVRAEKRPTVNQGSDGLNFQVAAGGNALHNLAELGFNNLKNRLTMGLGVFFFGEHIERVFIFVAVIHTGREAQLFQGAADEGRFRHQAGEANIPGRLEINPVKGGGQIIRAITGPELAKGLGIGNGRLAALPKGQDRIPNLLNFRQSHLRSPGARNQGQDALIRGGLVQRVHDIPDRHGLFHENTGQRVGWNILGKLALEVDLKYEAFR